MSRFSYLTYASLACLALACGGADSDVSPSTTGGSGGLGGSGGSGGSAGASGSSSGGSGGTKGSVKLPEAGYFDLSFSEVKTTMAMGPASQRSPSEDTHIRVDLLGKASGEKGGPDRQAVLTSRWGPPRVFDVVDTPEAVLLTSTSKGVVVQVDDGTGPRTESWNNFTLERDSEGTLTGEISAEGQVTIVDGDNAYVGSLSAEGKLALDSLHPEARANRLRPMLEGDQRLPWEALGVDFAEPIGFNEAVNFLSLAGADGHPIPLDWKPTTTVETSNLGWVTQVEGISSDWDNLSAATLSLAPGYADPSGNKGTGVESPYAILKVPGSKGAQKIDFAGGAPKTVWGPQEKLSNELCEMGSCLELGPFENHSCGLKGAPGLAFRLVAPPKSSELKIRLRLIFAQEGGSAGAAKMLSPLTVQTALRGSRPELHTIEPPATTDIGSGVEATAWTTFSVAIEGGNEGGEIGIAIRGGASDALWDCPGQSPPDKVVTKILLQGAELVPAPPPGK